MNWALCKAIIIGMIGGVTWCVLFSASEPIMRRGERTLLLTISAAALLLTLYWLATGAL